MPGMDGIELTRELAGCGMALPVILISGHADVPIAVAGIKAGAKDFIEKPIGDTHLVATIDRELARSFEHRDSQKTTLKSNFARLFCAADAREIDVFNLFVQGFTSQEVAVNLNISLRTVAPK